MHLVDQVSEEYMRSLHYTVYQHSKVNTKTRVTDFSVPIKHRSFQCVLSPTGTIYPVHGAADIKTMDIMHFPFCILVSKSPLAHS